MKKTAIIMDLTSVGRCALSVAMPVIAALGIQPCALPTSVLSTHMGGFGTPRVQPLTEFLSAAIAHHREIGVKFDAIYSGFLASDEQAGAVLNLINAQPSALVVIDPVMADHGKYYTGITVSRAVAYRDIACHADVITPNLTEANILAGLPLGAAFQESTLDRLLALGCRAALVTGAGNANACKERGGELRLLPFERVPARYPGTGDLFASVLIGRMMNGMALADAAKSAGEFVAEAVRYTLECGTKTREGVQFERVLRKLFE